MAGLGIYAEHGNVYSRLDLDFNNDKHETPDDLAALTQVIGGAICDTPTQRCDNPDFNRDGEVNEADITAFAGAMAGTYRVFATDIADYRFLYRGYWYDKHLGIYHVRHRAYDPTIQRWLQPDPAMFIDGMNVYAYCGNEPFARYDAMGLYGVSDYVHDVREGANEFIDPETIAGAIVNVAASFVPLVGEAMDAAALANPSSSGTTRVVAGVSLGVSVATAGAGPNVSSIFRLIDVASGGGAIGSYKAVAKWITENAPGSQANHLLQNAAFGKVIAREDGLTIVLKGSAFEEGTEHYKFHKVLDEFWGPYMKGDKVGTFPTIAQYLSAMEEALRAVGRYSEETIKRAMDDVQKQLDEHGLTLDADVPNVPKHRTTKCDATKETGS